MRIVQILPTYCTADAIGNEVTILDLLFKSKGYRAEIFCQNTSIAGVLKDFETFGMSVTESDVILYHYSIGDELATKVSLLPCIKIMRYHNITPPHFFRPYDMRLAMSCHEGYAQLAHIAPLFDGFIADSNFNKYDLMAVGVFDKIDVVPLLLDFEGLRGVRPSERVLDKYGESNGTLVLFTGRLAPNKCQNDLIDAFDVFKRKFDSSAQLILVGHGASAPGLYIQELYQQVEKLGLDDSVVFAGSVPLDELAAYYRVADVFVSQSEHEGFGVPFVESMIFGVPIVAYSCTAVPETIGAGGLLLQEKGPEKTAAAIYEVIRGDDTRQRIANGQQIQLGRFNPERVGAGMIQSIERLAGQTND